MEECAGGQPGGKVSKIRYPMAIDQYALPCCEIGKLRGLRSNELVLHNKSSCITWAIDENSVAIKIGMADET